MESDETMHGLVQSRRGSTGSMRSLHWSWTIISLKWLMKNEKRELFPSHILLAPERRYAAVVSGLSFVRLPSSPADWSECMIALDLLIKPSSYLLLCRVIGGAGPRRTPMWNSIVVDYVYSYLRISTNTLAFAGKIPNDRDIRARQFNHIPILTVAWRRGDREAGTDLGNGSVDHTPRNHAALT